MKENPAYSPADEARIRRRLRAMRDLGHTFDCAVALVVRSVRRVLPGRCLCATAHRPRPALRVVA
jgi:hypothetical protein